MTSLFSCGFPLPNDIPGRLRRWLRLFRDHDAGDPPSRRGGPTDYAAARSWSSSAKISSSLRVCRNSHRGCLHSRTRLPRSFLTVETISPTSHCLVVWRADFIEVGPTTVIHLLPTSGTLDAPFLDNAMQDSNLHSHAGPRELRARQLPNMAITTTPP